MNRESRTTRPRHAQGFSLVELVIVVVIIGIIGAIAIPRLSRGAEGAEAAKTQQDLAVLNRAIELYAAEHASQYPDYSKVEAQLLQYTDINGNVSATRTTTHIYGPYLRKIPAISDGPAEGSSKIGVTDTSDNGWLYDQVQGKVIPNSEGTEAVQIPLSL